MNIVLDRVRICLDRVRTVPSTEAGAMVEAEMVVIKSWEHEREICFSCRRRILLMNASLRRPLLLEAPGIPIGMCE